MISSFLTLKKNATFFYVLFFARFDHFCMTYETKKSAVFFYKERKRTQRTHRTQLSFIKNIKERKERRVLLLRT